ncbi:MAG: Cystathionine gamma-lyase [uncultured Acidimicrobiales bacterium]|uniref:Cystathionine gamma-lyase n=1 Tax=uncultured Acidimicrobiales bacterium TaxID=310071 RepID=A0A6J4IBL1_9ACTN|nr:MAG: Cystathionine gamma-lyase [uncultured Acidimicrobiales bacterium]
MSRAFETECVHGGVGPEPATGAVVTPVYLTSTFVQPEVGQHTGFEYSRTQNPSRLALERHLAALEDAAYGHAFASGLAATDAVLRLLAPGDHVLLPDDAYGGTIRLALRVHAPAGLAVETVDLTDLGALRAALRPTTRLVWVETPTNPLMRIVDIEGVAGAVAGAEVLVAVDNTFATPALQQPLSLGADLAVHSTTKYLGGHSDVVGGFVATRNEAVATRLAFLQNAVGAVPGPMDCFLVQRGAKTLAVRMERHCANAAAVVELLVGHPAVDRVLWPGLAGSPGHDVAARQMRDFGGMVSFTLKGGEAAALEVCRRTEVFTLAESLGAVESLIEHPGRMTHLSVAGTTNEVPSNLVRLSVGIEAAADLVADLTQALKGPD